MFLLDKRKPLRYLAARISRYFDLVPWDVTRVIAGSNRAYGIDISHWEESFDPDRANRGLIDFAIFKATEGTTWVDDRFESFYRAAAGKVPVIGAYHYLRSGMSGRTQADHFQQVVGDKDIDILVCDFESTNNTLDDAFVKTAKEFGLFVKAWKPGVKLLFYTNPSIYDSVVYPGCMRLYGLDVFTQTPWDGFWVAQYYLSPSPAKSPRMPDNRKDWVLWQFSEAGEPAQHGTGGWCDQNVFNGGLSEFNAWVDNGTVPEPPAGDIVETWFDDKVLYTRGHRENPRPFNFHVTRFLRSDVERVHVNGLGFHGTGIYFWNTRGKPDIVINGGHADYAVSPPIPWAPVVTDGQVQKTRIDEVSIQFDNRHQPIGLGWGIDDDAYNVVGVSDVLLQDGIIPVSVRVSAIVERIRSILPRVDDTYVDPRNALFWNDTEYILIDIDGRNDGTQGLTRLELAQFAQTQGAKWGGNLDGGDSNTLLFAKNDAPEIKNNPPDGMLHAVANHVGFWIKQGGTQPPTNGVAMYYETIEECLFYRVVGGVVKGDDGTLPKGYQLPYPADTIFQNNKTYKLFGALPGSVKPDNAIEENFLKVVDEVAPPDPPDPPAGVMPIRTVIELDDGTAWEATGFTKLS